jgi:hypothetical protein
MTNTAAAPQIKKSHLDVEWLDVDMDMDMDVGVGLVARTWAVEGATCVWAFCEAVNARLAAGVGVSDAIKEVLDQRCSKTEQVPYVGEPWEMVAGR